VGTGDIGEVTAALMAVYFDAVRGKNDDYRHWVEPVY
jgi:hypothetical protein